MGNATGDVRLSESLGKVMNLADKLSQDAGDAYISSEMVLLAMLDGAKDVRKILDEHGVQREALQAAVNKVRGANRLMTLRLKKAARPWISTQLTLPSVRLKASSTRLSVATRKSVVPSRCCSVEPRTILCLSVNPGSVKPPS